MKPKTLKKANKKTKEKAEQIIKQTIIRVKEQFPILIYAINLLEPKETEAAECLHLSTDGEHLFYNADCVIESYRHHGYVFLKRELLHVIMHGLLGHFDVNAPYRDRKIMWASMDREVAWMLDGLMGEEGKYQYWCENGGNLAGQMDEYLGDTYGIACYYKVKGDKRLRKNLLQDWKYIRSDEHEFWLKSVTKNGQEGGDVPEEKRKRGNRIKSIKLSGLSGKKVKEISAAWKIALEMMVLGDVKGKKSLLLTIQNGSAGGNGQGIGNGNMQYGVRAAKENQNSYYEILMEFLRMKETVKEDPDAIDPMLYHYGLELYGDVPLIESPEETERLHLNTLCIAMDTSGSCGGEVASYFLRETENILRDIGKCSDKGELYFWTCDDVIQQEKYYDDLSEINVNEWKQAELCGWGGTSFLPVFERIEKLREKGKNIDCLIYLTDGYGWFPEQRPDYPVYFIISHGQMGYDWPDWIHYIFLNLQEE